MSTLKWKLTLAEAREYRRQNSCVQQLGIAVGCDADFLQSSASNLAERLRLDQIDCQPATIFQLPVRAFAVVVPVRLLVLSSQCWITDSAVEMPWDCPELELSGAEDHPYYKKLMSGYIPFPPTLLNPLLTGKRPLRRGPVTGVIVATGYGLIPDAYLEYTSLPIDLTLYDESNGKLHFTCHAQVCRGLNAAYERQQRETSPACPPRSRFKRELGWLEEKQRVAPETAEYAVSAQSRDEAT